MNDFKTFIDSTDIEKLNEFYKEGFYAADTMLIMEADIKVTEKVNEPGGFEIYNTEDLKEYLKANGQGFGVPDPEDQVREQLLNPHSRIYVLRVKGSIASSVTVWDIDESTVATENIFTVPRYRERGYAQSLLGAALQRALKEGKTKARLTVYAGDIAAIKMYYKFGFEIIRVLQEFRHE